MSNDATARIGLDDVVAAAGHGALRALAARNIVPDSGQGFYVELHIRCGIPPYIEAARLAEDAGEASGALEE